MHRDQDDADIIRVSDVGREACSDALGLPGVRENAAEVMRLVAEPPELVEGHPLGGARMARGETGATVFSIPDAPDLSQDTELLGRYGLGQVGEERHVREQLGAAAGRPGRARSARLRVACPRRWRDGQRLACVMSDARRRAGEVLLFATQADLEAWLSGNHG